MKKKIISICLVLTLVVVCIVPAISLEASAASFNNYFTISNPYFPSTLTESHPRAIGGTITSNISLNIFYVGIMFNNIGEGGSNVIWSDRLPVNTRTYNIANLDSQIKFNELQVGNYEVKVLVKFDVDGLIMDGENFYLTITPATFSSSNIGYPTSIIQGRGFPITGTITSTGNITKVWVGAYRNSGTGPDYYITGVGATENFSVFSYVQAYNLANLDSQIVFNNLSRGTYYYKVTAELANGTRYTYINRSFTVV